MKNRYNLEKNILTFYIISFGFIFSAFGFLISSNFLIFKGIIIKNYAISFAILLITNIKIIIGTLIGAGIGIISGIIIGINEKVKANKKIIIEKNKIEIKKEIWSTLYAVILIFLSSSIIFSGIFGNLAWSLYEIYRGSSNYEYICVVLKFGLWFFIFSSLLSVGIGFFISLRTINSYYKLEPGIIEIKNDIKNKNYKDGKRKLRELKNYINKYNYY